MTLDKVKLELQKGISLDIAHVQDAVSNNQTDTRRFLSIMESTVRIERVMLWILENWEKRNGTSH